MFYEIIYADIKFAASITIFFNWEEKAVVGLLATEFPRDPESLNRKDGANSTKM